MASTNLLLVDDELHFVDSMARRLTKKGYNIKTACSGPDALAMLEKNSNISVVLLDIKMPGMDGIETLKEIKKRYPLVEIIILTGHATVDTVLKGMKLGAFDVLMKPCDLDQIDARVAEAADRCWFANLLLKV